MDNLHPGSTSNLGGGGAGNAAARAAQDLREAELAIQRRAEDDAMFAKVRYGAVQWGRYGAVQWGQGDT